MGSCASSTRLARSAPPAGATPKRDRCRASSRFNSSGLGLQAAVIAWMDHDPARIFHRSDARPDDQVRPPFGRSNLVEFGENAAHVRQYDDPGRLLATERHRGASPKPAAGNGDAGEMA